MPSANKSCMTWLIDPKKTNAPEILLSVEASGDGCVGWWPMPLTLVNATLDEAYAWFAIPEYSQNYRLLNNQR